MSRPALTFQRYTSREACEARGTVENVYRGSYIEAIERGDPFNSPDVFMRRFDTCTRNGAFDLVIAYIDGEPAGQSWGWPLTRP